MIMSKIEYKVSLDDWYNVLNTMVRYNRSWGFLGVLNNKLTYFDSKPNRPAMYITIEKVREYIQNY